MKQQAFVVNPRKPETLGALREYFKILPDKMFTVLIKNMRKNRSIPQNKYFHGVVCKILAEELGYSMNEMKDILKQLFLSELRILPDGQEVKILKETSKLNTEQFNELIENIQRWAASELNIYIPSPNQVQETDDPLYWTSA